jgi:hypothetical protein
MRSLNDSLPSAAKRAAALVVKLLDSDAMWQMVCSSDARRAATPHPVAEAKPDEVCLVSPAVENSH